MRQALTILGYILIGAAAAGFGTGFFLYRANADRSALVESKQKAEQQAEELMAASKKLADEANQKLEEASEEVAETRERLQALEAEQRMIKEATPLSRAPRTQYWNEMLNLPLGVTVRVPRLGEEIRNNEQGLIVTSRYNENDPWIEVHPWKEDIETRLNDRLENPVDVQYLVSGRLFVGKRGTLPDSSQEAYALRVQSGGTSTMMIWAKEGSGFSSDEIIDTFSSFTFRS